ncbi:hypothetical protein [Streptomyces goshikiensis]|uniref:AraC-like ligand-binding domain-containing protein n=1 Tax=Streptomyces goshikiensis TaxID=1942 RepID=UPI003648CE1C
MLLLDLEAVASTDRVDAFHHAMNDTSVPNDIVHESPENGIRARFETWRVGSLDLFDARSTGFEVRRTARHVRWHRDRPVVSVSLQTMGVHHAENAGERYVLGPDDIGVFHELAPRRYGWSGEGASWAVTIDMEHLGVPVDTVVRASVRLRTSPLHDLVLAHLRALRRDPGRRRPRQRHDRSGAGPADLGGARRGRPACPCGHGRLPRPPDLAYTRRHLTDPELTPDRIARALHLQTPAVRDPRTGRHQA